MADELFSAQTDQKNQPLAYRMSPRSLEEYIGQRHIVGPGRLLRRVIQADRLSSIIFYGPPGTGKTSLARVIARTTKSAFTTLNAVLSGVKELREAIKEAQEKRDLYGRRTILFVDEVHRWNKAQQDALLQWVENGTVVLIGATTQNPYFEVNSALVSRSRIFQLTPLAQEELMEVARQALRDASRGYGNYQVDFEEGALEHLIEVAGGDARSVLNALELAVETTPERFPPPQGDTIYISMDAAEQSIQKKAVLYDKEGDYHFDIISAFIKSVRGSDPDAALYWLARMVHAGEDPHFIFRRLLISASEDIGLADPYALGVVESAAAAFDRVGMPEGRYHLAHATMYLATTDKSNSSLGFFDALAAVEKEAAAEVPNHLRDANRDAKGFGHGEGYLYPHAYRDHWVNQQYLPGSLRGKIFYRPSEQGYEARIHTRVAQRREAQLAAGFEEDRPEVLTYSPPDKARDRWMSRMIENRGSALAAIRQEIFSDLKIGRHYRICVIGAEEGTLVWEALRQAPEGGVTGLVGQAKKMEFLQHYAEQLDEPERPRFFIGDAEQFMQEEISAEGSFDIVIGRNSLSRRPDKEEAFRQIFRLLAPQGSLVLTETVPRHSRRLSEAAREAGNPPEERLLTALKEAEERLYSDTSNPLLNWSEKDLEMAAKASGLKVKKNSLKTITEQRIIREQDIERWLAVGDQPSPLGRHLLATASDELRRELIRGLQRSLGNVTLDWSSRVCIIEATKPA